MPKPSSTIMVQIVRVAGSRSMRAEMDPAVEAAIRCRSCFLAASNWPPRPTLSLSIRRVRSRSCQTRKQRRQTG